MKNNFISGSLILILMLFSQVSSVMAGDAAEESTTISEKEALKNGGGEDKLPILSEVKTPIEKQKLLMKKVDAEMQKALSQGQEYSLGAETKAKNAAARYKDMAALEEAKKEYITKLAARIMAEEAEGLFKDEKDKPEKTPEGGVESGSTTQNASSSPQKQNLGPAIRITSIRTENLEFVVDGINTKTDERIKLKVGDIYNGYKFIGLNNGAAVFVDNKRAYLIRASW